MPNDKIQYLILGFTITVLAMFFVSPPAAFALGTAIGITKEIWYGTFRQFLATMTGAILGTIPYGVFLLLT